MIFQIVLLFVGPKGLGTILSGPGAWIDKFPAEPAQHLEGLLELELRKPNKIPNQQQAQNQEQAPLSADLVLSEVGFLNYSHDTTCNTLFLFCLSRSSKQYRHSSGNYCLTCSTTCKHQN